MIKRFIRRVLGLSSNSIDRVPREKHGLAREALTPSAAKVCSVLREAGFSAYVVGGAVRDLLLGIEPKDFDVATDARPEQIKPLFRRALIIGRRFRLVHVMLGAETVEVSTFRSADPGPAAPSLAGTCVTRSKPSCSCPIPAPSADRGHWRRSFGSPASTWHGTNPPKASECPGRSCRPSPRSGGTNLALQEYRSDRPEMSTLTARATKALRPSQAEQVVPAGLLGVEPSFELGQRARIFLHGPPYYRLGQPESSKYPPSWNLMFAGKVTLRRCSSYPSSWN